VLDLLFSVMCRVLSSLGSSPDFRTLHIKVAGLMSGRPAKRRVGDGSVFCHPDWYRDRQKGEMPLVKAKAACVLVRAAEGNRRSVSITLGETT
jgi:hypothetical protein